MYYIEQADKPSKIAKLLNKIKIEGNKIIIPESVKEIKENKAKKLAKKTHKALEKANSNKIVLSKKIQQNEIYKNMLYTYGYDIVDGKWLLEAISCKILDKIVEQKQIKKEETPVSVLVNNLTDYTLENIKNLSKEYKTLNIVTNHIEKFKKLEDSIFSENGLMITVTNNKKKSLAKSKIIVNIDFPQELINRYNIFDEAVIVNVNCYTKINKKRFNGSYINDYEISVNQQAIQGYVGELDKYNIKDLYEAEFYSNMPFYEFQNKIKKDGLQVTNLFRNRSVGSGFGLTDRRDMAFVGFGRKWDSCLSKKILIFY